MARAILDMPLPQNCYECPMRRMYRRKWFCQIIMHVALLDQRRPDCPLVEMDVKALLKHTEALQTENEQLQAQVARMREALTIANNYMPDIGQFCACGKCKTCGADINYAGYEHCVKCARGIIDEVLSDTPADVEALRKARKALCKGISELKIHCKYFDQTPEEDACIEMHEAVVEIDKALEGMEGRSGRQKEGK